MPRRKSIKTVCVDTVLFFALVALVGHLTINFWERYTIQSELSTMKHSLQTLKGTISNIGKAYDNLHTELKDLFKLVDKKQTKTPHDPCLQQEPGVIRCKNKYTLDRRTPHNLQVQAVLTKPNKMYQVGVGTETGDNGKRSYGRENKSTGPLGKNATTNTKNPSRSTGINSDMSNHDTNKYCQHNDSRRGSEHQNRMRCLRNFEHCRHMCNRVNAYN